MTDDPDVLLTPAETAALLKIHPSTLRRWRDERRGPPYVRIGRGYRYWRSAVVSWLATQGGPETSEGAPPPKG